jgi:hypothetical protein
MKRLMMVGLAGAAAIGGVLLVGQIGQAQTPTTTAASCSDGATNLIATTQAFVLSLSNEQRAQAVQPYEREPAVVWSNLPAAMVQRNGLALGDLSGGQQGMALEVIAAAMSDCGERLFNETRGAETVLNRINPNTWNPAFYYIAFVGDPSETAPWILQAGGHHVAFNIAVNSPQVSATPLFSGIEPTSFELDGRAYEPLAVQKNAMSALAAAIAERPGAQLSGTFRDITRGPGRAGDTNFPVSYPEGAEGRGVAYSSLAPGEQALVRQAMEAWVRLPKQAISEPLMAAYLSPEALDQTYVGFTGDTALGTQGAYVRIDGPRLWIEFVVQNAASSDDGVHFHTIWRDKTADYGGAFKG